MRQVKNSKKAAIVFLMRDCENSLPEFLGKIEQLRSYFYYSQVYIVENNSKDSTRCLLEKYQSSFPSVMLKTFDNPEFDRLSRIEKMVVLRNSCLDMIKASRYVPDYYIVVDGDLDFEAVSVMRAIQNAPSDWVALFANGRYFLKVGSLRIPVLYYDLYAYLPLDDIFGAGDCLTQREMIELRKNIQKALHSSLYVKCKSAFGGVAVYRYDVIGESRYSVEINSRSQEFEHLCEHIPFNREISGKGKLYICRDLKVYYEPITVKTWLNALAVDNDKEREIRRIEHFLRRLFPKVKKE